MHTESAFRVHPLAESRWQTRPQVGQRTKVFKKGSFTLQYFYLTTSIYSALGTEDLREPPFISGLFVLFFSPRTGVLHPAFAAYLPFSDMLPFGVD